MNYGNRIRQMTDEERADFFEALKTYVAPYCRMPCLRFCSYGERKGAVSE